MSHGTRVLPAVLLAAVAASSAAAQQAPTLARRLDSITGAEVRASRSVGISAAVSRGEDDLLLQAYGRADVENNAPMTPGTIVAIGSATKQFTAVAILQLRDQGALSLDDAVTRWLPEFTVAGPGLTLRHLLTHTAGIVEASGMPEIRAMQLLRNATVTRDSVYTIISRYPPAFPAGTMQEYSNTGFWLLGRVIEQASGMRYEDFLAARIFTPLGMSRSMVCDPARPARDRANGHGIRNGTIGRIPDIVHTATFAAGAICSTAADLMTWMRALHGGQVLSPSSYAELVAPARLADGTPLRYGLGTVVTQDTHGERYVRHSGGGFGFSSEMRWYPEARLGVVVLTNSEPDAISGTADDLAAAVLSPSPRGSGRFTGNPSPLLGEYRGRGRGGEMVVTATQGPQGLMLSVQGQPAELLAWVEGLTFQLREVLVTFRRGPGDDPSAELHFDTGGDHYILRRD